jgi:hypothetical protein
MKRPDIVIILAVLAWYGLCLLIGIHHGCYQ